VLVEDLMAKNISVCRPETNAAAAAEIMWVENCGARPVLDDSGGIAGIVTLTAGDAMQCDPAVCAPDDDVRFALRGMASPGIQRLPVVDQWGALKGVLSTNDVLLRISSETGGSFRGDVIRTLQAIGRHRQPQSAKASHATA
jgi:CBS domain-containing protein